MSDNEDDVTERSDAGQSSKGKSREQATRNSIKKRKLNRACDTCRKRKVRCDFVELPSGNLDKCLNCFSAQVDCTFNEDNKPRESTKSHLRSLEAKLKRAEKLVQVFCPDPVTREHLINGTLDSLPQSTTASGAWKEEPPTQSYEKFEFEDAWSPDPATKTNGPEEEDRCRMFSVPNRQPAAGTTSMYFIGESSESDLVMQTMRIKKQWEQQGTGKTRLGEEEGSHRRPEFWTQPSWEVREYTPAEDALYPKFQFPPEPLLTELVSLYFKHSNLEFPLVHRPRFEKDLQEQLHLQNPSFACIVLLVCAIGARYSDSPDVLLSEQEFEAEVMTGVPAQEADHVRERWRKTYRYSRGWRYFSQVLERGQSTRPVFVTTAVNEALCIPLAALYVRYTSVSHSAWSIVGVGLRMLQNVGVHRDRRYDSSDLDIAEQEQMRRIWWVVVYLDRILACELGRPLSIHPEDLDQVLPVECDDEYWDHPDPDLRLKQPANKFSSITGFNLQILLSGILSIIIRTVYATKSLIRFLHVDQGEWDERVVSSVNSRLNSWIDKLPSQLQWDPHNLTGDLLVQSAGLHIIYHYIHILLHWPFLVSPTRAKSVTFPSVTICNTSARSIMRIGRVLVERGGEVANDLIHPVFMAGVVLLMKTWVPGKSESMAAQRKKDLEHANECLVILKVAEKRTFKAGRTIDLFRALSARASDNIERPLTLGATTHQTGARVPPAAIRVPTESSQPNGNYSLKTPVASTSSGIPSLPFTNDRRHQEQHISPPHPEPLQGLDFLSGSALTEQDLSNLWQIFPEDAMDGHGAMDIPFSFEQLSREPYIPSYFEQPMDQGGTQAAANQAYHHYGQDSGIFSFGTADHFRRSSSSSSGQFDGAPASTNMWDWNSLSQHHHVEIGQDVGFQPEMIPVLWDHPMTTPPARSG